MTSTHDIVQRVEASLRRSPMLEVDEIVGSALERFRADGPPQRERTASGSRS